MDKFYLDFCESEASKFSTRVSDDVNTFLSNQKNPPSDSSTKIYDTFMYMFAQKLRTALHVTDGLGPTQNHVTRGGSSTLRERATKLKKLRRSFRGIFRHSHPEKVSRKSTGCYSVQLPAESKREGVVNWLISGDDNSKSSEKSKWEKYRMMVVNLSVGDIIELSPIDAAGAKVGILCMLIIEARQTSILEMPDFDNTFVIKTSNNCEYILQAGSNEDMRAWLKTIHVCMNEVVKPSKLLSGVGEDEANAPVTNWRGRPAPQQALPDASEVPDTQIPVAAENRSVDMLNEQSWFHGTLSRMEAARKVLASGKSAHGNYLVRQSETRFGEYVLSFNYMGRAKHLRMQIGVDGKCQIQHLQFESIFDMLAHFKSHPIPLENANLAEVTLKEFIVCAESVDGPSSSQMATNNNSEHQTLSGSKSNPYSFA